MKRVLLFIYRGNAQEILIVIAVMLLTVVLFHQKDVFGVSQRRYFEADPDWLKIE